MRHIKLPKTFVRGGSRTAGLFGRFPQISAWFFFDGRF
jgi:hypothetical protein